MKTNGPASNERHVSQCDEDARVMAILDAYLSGIEAGRPADPQKLLAEHPDLADRLRAYLHVMQMASRLGSGLGTGRSTDPGSRATESTSPSRKPSLLTTLDLGPGEPPQILLREPADEPEPLARPRSTEMPPDGTGPGPGRYHLRGEIARGGMGAILRGLDVDLGRELAIKVLLEAHRGNPQITRRFVEEAQIGGQLQHPGIVPVYDLGTFADRRPFFAMKLVKGRTLAALLAERSQSGASNKPEAPAKASVEEPSLALQACERTAADLPRFLSIFEAVCQTMAYAHARGVIHRDLKPSNVMVGSFGEVQVMDWGLAKVLPHGGIADEFPTPSDSETVITTVRSGSDADASHAGSVLGTPSYMAPEQARGELDEVDERADVFGLGAILCEILTGKPPFLGRDRHEIRDRAARGDLAKALGRLDACGADAELIGLAKGCLAAERDRRPRHAGEVAGRMTAYLAGVQARLRVAELARVEAQARAEEERKRRRVTVALTLAVFGLVALGCCCWAYLVQQSTARRAATERGVIAALAEARVWRDQARKAAASGNLQPWEAASLAARHARELVAQGEADIVLRDRVEAQSMAIEREQDEDKVERRLLDELETIRGSRSEHWDPKRSDADYAAAFRKSGIDPDELGPAEVGNRIARRAAPVELASYLDDWALVRRQSRDKKDDGSWRLLLAAAQAADPDPWRVAVRDAFGRDDRQELRRLAADPKTYEARPAPSLILLAAALKRAGDREPAQQVLRRSWPEHAGDFWLNYELGQAYWARKSHTKPEEAARFYSAAIAIRPRSSMAYNNLGNALRDRAQFDDSIAAYRRALQLKPDFGFAFNNLGISLANQGKTEEAIAQFRAALRLNANHVEAHDNLGVALAQQGRLDEAIAECRKACGLKPEDPDPHANLGALLHVRGEPDEAITELRTALRLEPGAVGAHSHLGMLLVSQGKIEEGIAECRESIRLAPESAEGHCNLGNALRDAGRFAEALVELRQGHELGSKNPRWRYPSAQWIREAERLVELDAKLASILAGNVRPVDAAEALGFAKLCNEKKLHGVSAGFWAEAFQAQPKLIEDMQAQHRYNAACAAALAGCGQGKDDPPLDDEAKARWRMQAVEWLKADLATWSKVLESGPTQARQSVSLTLQHWKTDRDLHGLRDEAALSTLPGDEQKACRALWAEVDALLAKARSPAP